MAGVETIEQYLGDCGGGVTMRIEDVASVDAAFDRISNSYGDISVLINNAGITRDNLLVRMSEDEWSDVIDTKDRKSVVSGKSVDLGGRRILKKKSMA